VVVKLRVLRSKNPKSLGRVFTYDLSGFRIEFKEGVRKGSEKGSEKSSEKVGVDFLTIVDGEIRLSSQF
jgi:hypothetical protein